MPFKSSRHDRQRMGVKECGILFYDRLQRLSTLTDIFNKISVKVLRSDIKSLLTHSYKLAV